MKRVSNLLRGTRALSLLEIIAVTAILALLAALLIPNIQTWIERSRTIKCLNQLRNVGTMLLDYAGDNNMRVSFFRGGQPTRRMWATELRQHAGLTEQQAQKKFGCPSMTFYQAPWTWYFVYGMRLHGAPGRVDSSQSTNYYELAFGAVDEPSKFFMMADSTLSNERQSFRLQPPGIFPGSSSGVHIRHQGRANVLFLDGHVESLDKEGLFKIGFTTVMDENRQPVSTIPEP